MSDLDNIVSVTVDSASAQVTREGFGLPLILDYHSHYADYYRVYTDLAGMVTDGFSTSSAAYLAASELLAQSPRPPSFAVGRRALPPTMRWAVTPTAQSSTTYYITINGTEVSYAADASATVAEIIAGLKSAIDALSLAITTSDQTTYLRIVANSAGAFFTVAIRDSQTSLLTVAQDHADPGVATDLNNILAENGDWYALSCTTGSTAEQKAIAAWAESNKKLFIAASQDTRTITLSTSTDAALTTSGTAAQQLKTAAYRYSAVLYHPNNGAFADAAWLGRVLPLTPGSETWAFKTLAGIAAVALTPTHVTNAEAKNCNYYKTIHGANVTQKGKVASGEWIDVVRFVDSFVVGCQERVFALKANNDKVPFTDAGISLIAAEVRAQIKDGLDAGGIAPDPEPTVTVPKASEVSSGNRTARILTPVGFTYTLAQAVQKTVVQGTVS